MPQGNMSSLPFLIYILKGNGIISDTFSEDGLDLRLPAEDMDEDTGLGTWRVQTIIIGHFRTLGGDLKGGRGSDPERDTLITVFFFACERTCSIFGH